MPRVISLVLPFFPTDLVRRKRGRPPASGRAATRPEAANGPPAADGAPAADGPLVTAAREGGRRVVVATDPAARALGIRPGQPVALATASVPGLAVVEATPDRDRAALDRLAAWCLRYGPVVQPDPPDAILIDVEGAAHLLGGERAVVVDLMARLARAGFTGHAGLADTPGAADALARHRPGTIAPPGGQVAALARLPVAGLRIPAETAQGLALLGIGTIGDLDRFPRPQLALRFGPALMRARDRATGDAPEPLRPLRPPTMPRARRAFAEPIGHLEGLVATVECLLPVLCRELARRGAGLRRLDAVFRRVDGRAVGIRIGTAAPTRDPAHLTRLLRERLPAIDPGFGIDEVVLSAPRTEALAERQEDVRAILDPGGAGHDPARLAPLVDRLSLRVGTGRVFRAAPVESRVPERAWRSVPPLARPEGTAWPAALPRPSRLIDPPEPVTALAVVVPDEPPAAFIWRGVHYVVRAADGPERVRGEWWRDDAELGSLRDYYRVEEEGGRRFWLFRDAPMGPDARWWLHGRFG